MRKQLFLGAIALFMLAGCAKEAPPTLSQTDPDIARARAFVEAQASNGQTRGVNKNHPALEAFEADWSRARVYKDKDKKLTVTEVPTRLVQPYIYAVLVERFGEQISLTQQEPHTRILVYEQHGKDKSMSIMLATLLPDEDWAGDLASQWTNPVNGDFSGIAVYAMSDGTPWWGARFANGQRSHDIFFGEDNSDERADDISIRLGIGQPPKTRIFSVEISPGLWYVDTDNNGYTDWVIVEESVLVVAYREDGGSGGSSTTPQVPPISPPKGPDKGSPGNNPDTNEDDDGEYFTVTVSAEPVRSALVSGFGRYSASYINPSMATISARPEQGFQFVSWTGSHSSTSLSFTVPVLGDMSFVAHLRPCYTDGKANPVGKMKLAPPVTNGVSNIKGATYGMTRKNEYGRPKMHNGIDLAGPVGTPVFAQFDGTISSSPKPVNGQPDKVVINGKTGYPSGYVGDEDGGGNRIYIDSSVGGKTVKNGYMHLMAGTPFGTNPTTDQPWKPGDKIKAGEVIGYIGITGNANEKVPHLHLRTLVNGAEVDPKTYLNATVSTIRTTITTPCN